MNYKRINAIDVVIDLLISDGDSTREARYNIMNPNLLHIGAYSGTHTTNGHQSCIVYAATYTDNIDEPTVTRTE